MQRFNIVTKKTYKGRNGEEKAQWNNVGSLVQFPANGEKEESFALELSMFPETKFYVFPQKERGGSEPKANPASGADISSDEIPF